MNFQIDSRDKHAYIVFGQNVPPPIERNFDDPNIPEEIQPIGDIKCTAYTGTYIGQNKTKKEYDIDELFSRVPHGLFGAEPRDVLKEIVKNGFLIKNTTEYDKPFSSYLRADTGMYDPFTNCMDAMEIAKSPLYMWTYWYKEWVGLTSDIIMPIGMTKSNGHVYASKGWFSTIDGEPVFVIEWWGGFTMNMPREVFNRAISVSGCGAVIFSTKKLESIPQRSIFDWISDFFINTKLWLNRAI